MQSVFSPVRDSHSAYRSLSLSLFHLVSLCLCLPPLRSSVTSPPRVDWIHLTGYTACDITALWCMAERVVALRHHNLTSAMEWNGSRAIVRASCVRCSEARQHLSVNESADFEFKYDTRVVEVCHYHICGKC